MLKAEPPAEVEQKIRSLAAKAGLPITQFLNPFLTEIAEGRIKMVPQAQQPQGHHNAAAPAPPPRT